MKRTAIVTIATSAVLAAGAAAAVAPAEASGALSRSSAPKVEVPQAVALPAAAQAAPQLAAPKVAAPQVAAPKAAAPKAAAPKAAAPKVAAPTVAAPKVAAPKVAAPSTNQQITDAVRRSSLLGAVSADNVTVGGITFAASDPSWAAATVTPTNGQTDPAQVVLHKTGSTWQVRDLGTFGVGCGSAPAAVRTQLGLHGPC
ncbi:hypothetical protein [Flexivirga aerilata]|uniref:hypothetical protein n=1 Tax=Flexivirga aerilata TaxID=1656889 RepID=UPI001BB109FF|nr:hypothetical protein [Flexivirga aerilata]